MFGRLYHKLCSDGFSGVLSSVDARLRLFGAVRFGGVPRLRFVAVEVTNACNLHCGMCEIERKRKAGLESVRFIDVGFFKRVIDECAGLGVEVSLNFGGESLLHPRFEELLEYAVGAKERGLGKISWFDNGMLFGADVSRLVCDFGVDEVIFSVDKFGVANDVWRVGSDISVIDGNIRELIEMRGVARKPFVMINKVDVEDEFVTKDFIDYWLGVGVDAVQVSTLRSPIWRVFEPEKYYCGRAVVELPFCPFPFYFLGVLADGRVCGCGCDASAENLMGNLNLFSLKHIWESERCKSFRLKRLSGVSDVGSPCGGCDCWLRRFKVSCENVWSDVECLYGETKVYRRFIK